MISTQLCTCGASVSGTDGFEVLSLFPVDGFDVLLDVLPEDGFELDVPDVLPEDGFDALLDVLPEDGFELDVPDVLPEDGFELDVLDVLPEDGFELDVLDVLSEDGFVVEAVFFVSSVLSSSFLDDFFVSFSVSDSDSDSDSSSVVCAASVSFGSDCPQAVIDKIKTILAVKKIFLCFMSFSPYYNIELSCVHYG